MIKDMSKEEAMDWLGCMKQSIRSDDGYVSLKKAAIDVALRCMKRGEGKYIGKDCGHGECDGCEYGTIYGGCLHGWEQTWVDEDSISPDEYKIIRRALQCVQMAHMVTETAEGTTDRTTMIDELIRKIRALEE